MVFEKKIDKRFENLEIIFIYFLFNFCIFFSSYSKSLRKERANARRLTMKRGSSVDSVAVTNININGSHGNSSQDSNGHKKCTTYIADKTIIII